MLPNHEAVALCNKLRGDCYEIGLALAHDFTESDAPASLRVIVSDFLTQIGNTLHGAGHLPDFNSWQETCAPLLDLLSPVKQAYNAMQVAETEFRRTCDAIEADCALDPLAYQKSLVNMATATTAFVTASGDSAEWQQQRWHAQYWLNRTQAAVVEARQLIEEAV